MPSRIVSQLDHAAAGDAAPGDVAAGVAASTQPREIRIANDSPGSPTVWGLPLRDLYDAWWAAHGVQVVRRGETIGLQRGAELYMLVEPHTLVLFDLREFAERLAWRNARLVRLRVIDEDDERYSERVELDESGNVRSIIRQYRPHTRRSSRIMLTTSRRLASIWMSAPDARAGWSRLRRRLPWSSVDFWRMRGECGSDDNADELADCINRIVERWPQPNLAIDGIEALQDGVWSLLGAPSPRAAVVIGPVWAGNAALNDSGACIIGPHFFGDTQPCAGNATALVRPIHLIEPAGASREDRRSVSPGWANSMTKRAIDIVFSAAGLLMTLPLFALIALLIRREDGRPVFFGHERQTRGGGNFMCWKFRTMVHNAREMADSLRDANQADGPQFFIRDDPRVTRVGRWLRRFHLDELPQLFNVLRGQMSLVGPRPSPDDENQYCPAWRDARLSVRPGITGLWQLKRTREEGADFQEWIRYDIEYVRTAGFMLDVKILFMTLWSMIRRRRDESPPQRDGGSPDAGPDGSVPSTPDRRAQA